MRLGAHLMRFDAVEPARLGRDGPLLPDGARGLPRERPDAGGVHHARHAGRPHEDGAARRARHGRDLPAPRPAREDRRHPGRAVPGPRDARCGSAGRSGTPTTRAPFEGEHHRLAETLCRPLPVSRPGHGPEVLVVGSGERKTLRLVAQYGDACNLFETGPEEVGRELDVLCGHCDDVGRDYGDIRVTLLMGGEQRLSGDVDGFVAAARPYADLGVETVIPRPPAEVPLATWVRDHVAPAVPWMAELGAR